MADNPAERADKMLADLGLEPLEPYSGAGELRRCRCLLCGVTRSVRMSNLRRSGSIACAWCHGWKKWGPWGIEARERAATWRQIAGPDEVLTRLHTVGLAPITEVGDEYLPAGFVCTRCGDVGVTMPERISIERPHWFGCERCARDNQAQVRADGPATFERNGLRLIDDCRGEFVPQQCVCIACGTNRQVAYADLVAGTAPLCWTCTHGIRPDEPHRVYLVRYISLGVFKVGLTHNRHDRRLLQHQIEGGEIIDTVVVENRASARQLERWIIAAYARWSAPTDIGPLQFPQGGWTETWSAVAPPLDLAVAATTAGVRVLAE